MHVHLLLGQLQTCADTKHNIMESVNIEHHQSPLLILHSMANPNVAIVYKFLPLGVGFSYISSATVARSWQDQMMRCLGLMHWLGTDPHQLMPDHLNGVPAQIHIP
jgi:hypothetical protein